MPGKFNYRNHWAAAKHKIVLKINKTFLSSFAKQKKHVEPCCVVLCRTMLGPKTCARRQEKQAPDRALWGVYLASRLHKCQSSLNHLINIPHSNVFLTCLISFVDGALKEATTQLILVLQKSWVLTNEPNRFPFRRPKILFCALLTSECLTSTSTCNGFPGNYWVG
jgi:hypothetical protein